MIRQNSSIVFDFDCNEEHSRYKTIKLKKEFLPHNSKAVMRKRRVNRQKSHDRDLKCERNNSEVQTSSNSVLQ